MAIIGIMALTAQLGHALTILGAQTIAPTAASISAEISQVVKAGGHEYTLPASLPALDGTIVVPQGVQGFTLRGAPGGTRVKADRWIGYVVSCGPQMRWDQEPIRSRGALTVPVSPVKEGSTAVALASPLTLAPGDCVALMSRQWVTHTGGTDAQCNEFEIARVVSNIGGSVVLDRPVARDYTLQPSLSLVTDVVSTGIRVEGITFDATFPGGRNSGVVQIGLVDGFTLKDLETDDFGSRSVQINGCRDGVLERVTTRRGADIGNPGSGYGPTIMRSRDVLVKDCFSEATRHGFMATNGSTDIAYYRCKAPDSNFDTHGFNERRISYNQCQANTVNCGNFAYLGGAVDTSLTNCRFGTLLVNANVDRTTVTNCDFSNLSWQSLANDPKARPSGGKPTNVLVKNSRVSFVKSFFSEQGDIDGLTIEDTPIVGGADSYTQVGQIKYVTGGITFRRSPITILGGSTYSPFELYTASPTFSLSLEDEAINVGGASWGAVLARRPFKGSVNLRGSNTFGTTQRTALFLANDPGGAVKAKGDVTQAAVKAPALSSAAVGRN